MFDRLCGAGASLQCNPSVAPFRVLAHPPVPLPPSQCAWCRVIPHSLTGTMGHPTNRSADS